jgi:hypothetical protein
MGALDTPRRRNSKLLNLMAYKFPRLLSIWSKAIVRVVEILIGNTPPAPIHIGTARKPISFPDISVVHGVPYGLRFARHANHRAAVHFLFPISQFTSPRIISPWASSRTISGTWNENSLRWSNTRVPMQVHLAIPLPRASVWPRTSGSTW